MYLEFTVSQEMEFFLACHENAWTASIRMAGKTTIILAGRPGMNVAA
jgi:hypothetical protein